MSTLPSSPIPPPAGRASSQACEEDAEPGTPAEPPSVAHLRLPVLDARPTRPARGATLIASLERPLLALDRLLDRALPPALNPFAQTGAIACTSFVIALVTGVALLFWYAPSLGQAHASLEAMRSQWWGGQLVRSVHRYSSDACMLFVVLHAWRLFAARRFGGARSLGWVTGLASASLLWVVGWLGYWLVWDDGARAIALGTARVLEAMPLFGDSLSRSFLTDELLSTLLFVVVFFLHMLIPLVIGVALWMHLTRLSRPRFLTGRAITLWVIATVLVVSLARPALSSAPASMLETPTRFPIDLWYLWPVLLTDRFSGGLLWIGLLSAGVVAFSVPWTLARARAVAAVIDSAKCNACYNCASDCPYGAIQMVPRTDGRSYDVQAVVDPKKCVGCGICSGSCDSGGIGLPWLSQQDVRRNMDAFLARRLAAGAEAHVAFVCAGSVPLRIDPDTGESEDLPGYFVWPVPCAGWVHALTIERAFRHGAKGALVAACPTSTCEFREGALWTEERIAGAREPALREREVDRERVRVVHVDRTDRAGLRRAAEALRQARPATRPRRSRVAQVLTGAGLAVTLGAATTLASAIPYSPAASPEPVLVVSFEHPGESVRLRVRVDGRVAHERTYAQRGIFGGDRSTAVVRLPLAAGMHRVEVALGDSRRPGEWSEQTSRYLRFASRRQRAVIFDGTSGFTWR